MRAGAGLIGAWLLAGLVVRPVWAADPAAGRAVALRVGDHPGFGRVVVDLPPGARYEMAQEGERMLLVLPDGAVPTRPAVLPRNFSGVSVAGAAVTLAAQAGSRLRAVRMGDRLVVDALDAAPRPARPGPGRGGTGDGQRPVPPASVPGREQRPPVPPVVTEAAPVLPVKAEPLPASVEGAPAIEAAAPLPAPSILPLPQPVLLAVDAGVGAAAFRRGGVGVVVLDRRLALEAPGWEGARVVPGALSTTVTVPLPPDRRLKVTRLPAGWRLEQVTEPMGATLAPQTVPTGLAFPLARAGRRVAIIDPVDGGALLVGTSLVGGPDAAVAEARRAPDHRVLPTWLGVAIEPLADQVEMRSTASGFLLASLAGPPARPGAALPRRFDLPDEPPAALANRLQAALASAAEAPARARSRPRIAAAQAYIALGMGAEAQAVLSQVAADDPQAAADAQVPALTGVAAVMAGRLDEAGGLDDPRLDDAEGREEVALWRGLRDRRQGRETPAAQALASSAPLARAYPATLRRVVWPDVAEAAVEGGTTPAEERLPRFATALRLERTGAVDEALAAYDALRAGDDRQDQVRATVRAAELRLASGRIGPGEAADIVGREVFAWRGDRRELAMRLREAELRSAAKGWRVALEHLRETEALFPDEKPAIARRKTAVFEAMLAAEGGGMSPRDVVLLAADFADCVPDGAAGAELAALLADKLTALDLPARTIPVLQGLTRTAAGPARAELGGRLAELLLDGGDAAGAVAALRNSASADLPPALAERRALALARGQAAQGDAAGAVAGLVQLGTAAADELRARLLAAAGDRAGALAALMDLAAKVVPAEGALPDAAQEVVLRAASAAAEVPDAAVLQRLAGFAPRMSPARADLLRVLTAAPVRVTAELPRAADDLRLARLLPQRLQGIAGR